MKGWRCEEAKARLLGARSGWWRGEAKPRCGGCETPLEQRGCDAAMRLLGCEDICDEAKPRLLRNATTFGGPWKPSCDVARSGKSCASWNDSGRGGKPTKAGSWIARRLPWKDWWWRAGFGSVLLTRCRSRGSAGAGAAMEEPGALPGAQEGDSKSQEPLAGTWLHGALDAEV